MKFKLKGEPSDISSVLWEVLTDENGTEESEYTVGINDSDTDTINDLRESCEDFNVECEEVE